MKCHRRILVAATLFSVLAGCGEAPAKKEAEGAAAADIGWFQNVRLIPGDGSPAIQDAFVVTENGKITKIGSKAEVPAPKGATAWIWPDKRSCLSWSICTGTSV